MMNAFIQEHDLFPAVLPFHTGRLARGGHDLYFEECGKQTGRPILFLHGGPGAGIAPSHRRLFNPDRFRCVLFDQRGSGQSRPFASIESNTTDALIDDIEALRNHLGVEKFIFKIFFFSFLIIRLVGPLCRPGREDAMAQWQRVGFQIPRLGVRIPLASEKFVFIFFLF